MGNFSLGVSPEPVARSIAEGSRLVEAIHKYVNEPTDEIAQSQTRPRDEDGRFAQSTASTDWLTGLETALGKDPFKVAQQDNGFYAYTYHTGQDQEEEEEEDHAYTYHTGQDQEEEDHAYTYHTGQDQEEEDYAYTYHISQEEEED
ncbi:hypothetical protein SCAR479_11931 [Seiridium cardinale]|uniref:Uncharacterized protein n=1 Tax=Seiridium cardinale TaxID=138064 RepID=A0ABR2XCG4_9PEZI